MRKITLLIILAALAALAAPLHAQRLNLDFPALAEHATESTDVTLDGPMLLLASEFLSDRDPDERQARDIIKTWVKNGVLLRIEYDNPKTRKPVTGLQVDDTKRPS